MTAEPVVAPETDQARPEAPGVDEQLAARAAAQAAANKAIQEAIEREKERKAREEAEAAARLERLRKRAEQLIEKARKQGALGPDSADEEVWDDLAAHKRAKYVEWWQKDIRQNRVTELAAYNLDAVEDDYARVTLTRFIDQLHTKVKTHLILHGGVGTGKTSAALAAGHYAVSKGINTRYVSHERYIEALRASSNPPEGLTKDAWRHRYRVCELLILDDLAADNVMGVAAKEFVQKETLTLISDRLHTGKATIVTLNYTYDDLVEILGDRVCSRLGTDAVSVKLTGPDRRQPLRWE